MTNDRIQDRNLPSAAEEIRLLRRRVAHTRQRMRWIRIGQVLFLTLQAAAGWLVLLFLLDCAFHPVWIWRILLLLVSGLAAVVWVLRRVPSVHVSLAEAAERIEQTHPELREAVTNAIAVEQSLRSGHDIGSPQLASAFLRQVEQHAKIVRPSAAAPFGELRRPLFRALLTAAAVAITLGASPATTLRFVQRVFALQDPRTIVLRVEPGDADCVEGQAVTFLAEAGGVIPAAGSVELTYDDRNVDVIELLRDGIRFTSLPVIPQGSASYRVRLGRAVSKSFTLRVIRYPQLRIEIVAQPPAYSGLPRQTVIANRGRLLAGSSLRVIVTSTKDLREAELQAAGGKLTLNPAEPRRFEGSFPLYRDLDLDVHAVDTDGLAVSESLQLRAVPDAPPMAVLNGGQPELSLPLGADVVVAYDIRDDLGLLGMELRGRFYPGGGEPVGRAAEQPLARIMCEGKTRDAGTACLPRGHLLQNPGDRLELYAVVADNSPARQFGRSAVVTVRAVGAEQARQLREAQRQQMAERLKQIEHGSQRAKQLAYEQRWDEALEQQQQCSDELAELREQLQQQFEAGASWSTDPASLQSDQRLRQHLDAAWEASEQLAQELQSPALPPSDTAESAPSTGEVEQTRQRLEQEIERARAFADPGGQVRRAQQQLRALLEDSRQREPLADDASSRTAGDRAEFWSRRKQQADRLGQSIQRAEQQGIVETEPRMAELAQAIDQAELSDRMAEARRALEQMDIAQARQLENQIDEQLKRLESLLDENAPSQPAVQSETEPQQESPAQQLEDSHAMEQIAADTQNLQDRQQALRNQTEGQADIETAQQEQRQAEQQSIAQAAEALAQRAQPLDVDAGEELQQAAQAAARAAEMLRQSQPQQAGQQQAACQSHLDTAARELDAALNCSLDECQEAAAQEQEMARDLQHQIKELLQQAAAAQAGQPPAAMAQQCEQLAEAAEQAGADQVAQHLCEAACAAQRGSLPGGQPSGQPGRPGGSQPGGQPSGQPGRPGGSQPGGQLAQAERAARQIEAQAAKIREAAAAAARRLEVQRALAQMAGEQRADAQPGRRPGPVDAAKQRALARRIREMAEQIKQSEAIDLLRQAADAADSAAQAADRNDLPAVRDAQVISARRLEQARRALTPRPVPAGAGAGDQPAQPVIEKVLEIDVSPEIRQQVRVFFDSRKPAAYTEQLRNYSTQLRIGIPPGATVREDPSP